LTSDFINQVTGGEILKALDTQFKNIKPTISQGSVEFQTKDYDDIDKILMKLNLLPQYYALAAIKAYINIFESNFNYISSFRMMPERTYTQKTVSEPVKSNGDNTITQIFHWKTIASPEFKQLIKELRDMQLLNALIIRKYRGGTLRGSNQD
jgi:hypothetical protein